LLRVGAVGMAMGSAVLLAWLVFVALVLEVMLPIRRWH